MMCCNPLDRSFGLGWHFSQEGTNPESVQNAASIKSLSRGPGVIHQSKPGGPYYPSTQRLLESFHEYCFSVIACSERLWSSV